MIAGSMLIRSAIHALKMDTGYDSKHVVDLDLQFPEGSKYTADRKAALVRELRTRLAALPGVAAITSARAPDVGGFRTAAVSLNGEKPSAQNTRAILYYTYVQANYFQTLGIPLLFWARLSIASRPAGALRHPQRIGRQTALARTEPHRPQPPFGATAGSSTMKGELLPDGPAYQVIGVARDTRGVMFDGSDSEQVYLPLPEDRLQDYPILIRTQSDPTQVMSAIGPVISSVDPDLVAYSSTLEEMLRQTDVFPRLELLRPLSLPRSACSGFCWPRWASTARSAISSFSARAKSASAWPSAPRKRDILGLMLRESTRPVLAGLLAGCFSPWEPLTCCAECSMGSTPSMASPLPASPLLFLAIALLAAYLPSRRAMRVDPMVALRYE